MQTLRVVLMSAGLIALAACGDLSADLESAKQEVGNLGREALEVAGGEVDARTACMLAGHSDAFCGCLSERLGPEITAEQVEAVSDAVLAGNAEDTTSVGDGEQTPAAQARQAVIQCAARAAIDGAIGEGAN